MKYIYGSCIAIKIYCSQIKRVSFWLLFARDKELFIIYAQQSISKDFCIRTYVDNNTCTTWVEKSIWIAYTYCLKFYFILYSVLKVIYQRSSARSSSVIALKFESSLAMARFFLNTTFLLCFFFCCLEMICCPFKILPAIFLFVNVSGNMQKDRLLSCLYKCRFTFSFKLF